jgi:CRISPR-associated protein Csm4
VKLYEIVLKPKAGFGTPLKGDTIFGHICWQAAHFPDLLEGGLEHQISLYSEQPFAIFSSAFIKLKSQPPTYAIKRPDVPLTFSLTETERKQRIVQSMDLKAKTWMKVEAGICPNLTEAEFLTDDELIEILRKHYSNGGAQFWPSSSAQEPIVAFSQPHNTINRLTETTGPEMFAPYTRENHYYYPGTELAVFVLINETATDVDRVCDALSMIGKWGFGRDASTGLGRFEVNGHSLLDYPDLSDADACYTLAPSVPERNHFEKIYFYPFVRLGKHGDVLAGAKNPFKNPVIMADEGAVLVPKKKSVFSYPYIGKAVAGVSKAKPETVVQGYAPYLPIKLKEVG